MIGQLLVARPSIAIVLGKAAIFHHGLNFHRVDNMMRTLLDFSFIFVVVLRQKVVAAEEWEIEKKVASVEDDG